MSNHSRLTEKTFVSNNPKLKCLFKAIDIENNGLVKKADILNALTAKGIQADDPRITNLVTNLDCIETDDIDYETFKTVIQNNLHLIEQVLTADLIIPNFEDFTKSIEQIYQKTKKNNSGEVADYIPQLKRVPPTKYGISICTTDGQRYGIGDTKDYFVVQSVCKPINYCLSLEEHGDKYVHEHVGREPSGTQFNALTLNKNGRPHNPMINSGAIMSCSMIKQDLTSAEKFDYVLTKWQDLSGGNPTHFNNSVYLSEKQTADRNFALGYFMREKNIFPEKFDLVETLEFYFQCCSIELTTDSLSIVAATLANGGVNPLTGKRIFNAQTVQNCLSLMYSCGMYDFSGEFAFTIGIPAKSGVSGVVMLVIPNVMGIAIWSPKIDEMGNSVRGVEFCKELIKLYNFHNYDTLINNSKKTDPRLQKHQSKMDNIMSACWSASTGDLNDLKRLVAAGVNLDDADYDGRTPLHLAAAEGQSAVVEYFITHGVNINPKDRWGSTPFEDAINGDHLETAAILKEHGAVIETKLKQGGNSDI